MHWETQGGIAVQPRCRSWNSFCAAAVVFLLVGLQAPRTIRDVNTKESHFSLGWTESAAVFVTWLRGYKTTHTPNFGVGERLTKTFEVGPFGI